MIGSFEAGDPTAAAGVHLSDCQHVLSLFTQGLAGRYLDLRAIEVDEAEGMRGELAGTDGLAIYLPREVTRFPSRRHNLGVYRIALLHQLGFHDDGTFTFSLEQALQSLPAQRRKGLREGRPPDEPVSDLERFFAMAGVPALLRRLFTTLEDLRIDCALRRRYPGARADLERVLSHALAQRPAAAAGELAGLGALLEALLQYTLGASPDALLAQSDTAVLGALLKEAAALRLPGATVYDSARSALACHDALIEAGLASRRPLPGGEDRDAEVPDHAGAFGDDDGPQTLGPEFRSDKNVRFEDGMGEIGATEGEEQQEQDEEGDEQAQPKKAGFHFGIGGGHAKLLQQESPSRDGRSFLYDEWDFHHQAYIKGWCRLYETRLQGDNFDFIQEVRRRHATLARQVRRRFKFIRPESLQRVHRMTDGEELELDGVIEALIDRRAGSPNDDRVYSRRSRAVRDVAAAFLLDMSASTGFPLPDAEAAPAAAKEDGPLDPFDIQAAMRHPAAPKRQVIDVARESLALMSEALAALGDSHAVYGFSSHGHDRVEFYIAKEFEDRQSARTWAAMGAMTAQLSTRMGPAIRHAVSKLARQSQRLKVLIVVSDGYPQDIDYGPDRMDAEYGIQDTARALREAAEQGVQTFCITIDPTGHDYLRRMCPGNRYMVIDEVQDLPGELTKVYRALTA